MTKHEYEGYSTRNHYAHSFDTEEEGSRHLKSSSVKSRKKSETEIKKRLQGIKRYSDDILEDE